MSGASRIAELADAAVLELEFEASLAWQKSAEEAERRAAAADAVVVRLRAEVDAAKARALRWHKTAEEEAQKRVTLEAQKEELARLLAVLSAAPPVQKQLEELLASQRSLQHHVEALSRAVSVPAVEDTAAPLSAHSSGSGKAWRYEFPVWCYDVQGTYRVASRGTSHSDRVVLDGTVYTRSEFVAECMTRAGITPPSKRPRADDFILFQKGGGGHGGKRVKIRGNAVLRARDGAVQNELREIKDPRVGDRARGKSDEDDSDDSS
jgi:hypothetical protein